MIDVLREQIDLVFPNLSITGKKDFDYLGKATKARVLPIEPAENEEQNRRYLMRYGSIQEDLTLAMWSNQYPDTKELEQKLILAKEIPASFEGFAFKIKQRILNVRERKEGAVWSKQILIRYDYPIFVSSDRLVTTLKTIEFGGLN